MRLMTEMLEKILARQNSASDSTNAAAAILPTRAKPRVKVQNKTDLSSDGQLKFHGSQQREYKQEPFSQRRHITYERTAEQYPAGYIGQRGQQQQFLGGYDGQQ